MQSNLFETPRQTLATVDIILKGASGLELIKIIKPISVGLQVLVLSLYEESLCVQTSLFEKFSLQCLHKRFPSHRDTRAGRSDLSGE
jgi:hypothetical protein